MSRVAIMKCLICDYVLCVESQKRDMVPSGLYYVKIRIQTQQTLYYKKNVLLFILR